MSHLDDLVQLLTPVIADLGFDVEAVELTGKGKNRRLLVAIDADGGVGIDEITLVTRALGEFLELPEVDSLLGKEPYTLEVSSRGTHRPLTAPRHWRRNVGRLVAIDPADPVHTDGRFEARIVGADDDGVDLATKNETSRWAFDDIAKAVVHIEFAKTKKKKDA
jgi:ribosome maturation factor RimP